MAGNLLVKLANGEDNLETFKKWMLPYCQDSYELASIQCTQQDFLTYFLNFVHEKIQCSRSSKSEESRTKNSIHIHKKENKIDSVSRRNCERINVKSTSHPLGFDQSLEKAFDNDTSLESNLTTPKVTNIHCDSSLNASYFSPVSPLYQNPNKFSTPKNKNTSGYKPSDRLSPLCLSDFIVAKKSSSKKKKQSSKPVDETSKRIKPTFVDKEKKNSFQNTTNSFSNFDTKEEDIGNHSENRNYLVEERLKILSKKSSSENLLSLSKKLSSSLNPCNEVEIDINLISYKKQLTNLAEIYTFILNNYLVLNVNSEVYFLISLLLNKNLKSDNILNDSDTLENDFMLLSSNDQIECCNFFMNVHNIVYFVVKCLELSIGILRQYDKTTLWLLSENTRIKTFSIHLSEELKKISNQQSERISELLECGDEVNVCFNLDTDNRDNFPNEFSFHSFRKQRDLFYEILRIWEHNHSLPGWSFSISLGGKIKSLLSLQNEAINYIYFCRLFKDQLLNTYGKTLKESDVSEMNTSFLSSLPNIDANKLNRLKNRLVTKDSCVSFNSLPLFMGYQEFYKEFILHAANYIFNSYLRDIFISEIVELNEIKFLSTDFEESDETSNVDPQTKKAFVVCLQRLRVLAKFLGFIETLPYKSEISTYPEKVLSAHIEIRQQITPSLDIRQILIESIKRNTLVQIIPWLTEYLSMLDTVTLRLPYYISVHKILFRLYRTHEISSKRYNTTLIKSSLGWLFELPHFPDSEFFNFYTSDLNIEDYANWKYKIHSLDNLNVVDLNILYTFCPYLEEIKKLLTTNTLNNKITAKHITPVSAAHSNEQISEEKLQQRLEEAFLKGQPGSVRKTIEFVSERIASACVKHLCYIVVPDYKKKASTELKTFLQGYEKDKESLDENFEATLKQKVYEMIPPHISSLKQHCGKEVSKLLRERLPPALENLLAVDTLPQTKAVCVSISVKMCKERIKQWIETHINTPFLTKEFDSEVSKFIAQDNTKNTKRKPIFVLPSMGNRVYHNEDSLSAPHALDKIRCFAIDIIEKPTEITLDTILTILQDTRISLTERCDVNENINSCICTLLVDTSLLLCAHRPDILFNDECTKLLVEIWKLYYTDVEELFVRLLCPRNVAIMAQAHNDDVAWDNFAKFAAFLIKENMLPSSAFASQCTEFYRRDWDENTLKNLSHFSHRFIEYYKKNGGTPDQFTFLLEFFSASCRD